MIQATTEKKTIRCAIYTRKSHEEGLEQEFNSLDAQRAAAEAYIASQRHEGWVAVPPENSVPVDPAALTIIARSMAYLRQENIESVLIHGGRAEPVWDLCGPKVGGPPQPQRPWPS